MDILCQYPVKTNKQRKRTNFTDERHMSLDILAETIKQFKGLTLQSTIKDAVYYNSDKDDAESDQEAINR